MGKFIHDLYEHTLYIECFMNYLGLSIVLRWALALRLRLGTKGVIFQKFDVSPIIIALDQVPFASPKVLILVQILHRLKDFCRFLII